MNVEKVSLITPTRDRESYLLLAYQTIFRQTYPNLEWLIYDNSPEPSSFFRSLNDTRVRYRHTTNGITIGEKRNQMIGEASGSIIVHWDDDDYYAPTYVQEMVAKMNGIFDFVKLSGWFTYSTIHQRFAYWDMWLKTGPHIVWSEEPLEIMQFDLSSQSLFSHLSYGFSYVYKKKVWEKVHFPDVNWNEDAPFAIAAKDEFRISIFPDQKGICLHILHRYNTSRCFPQYIVPPFIIPRLFDSDVNVYLK